VPILGLDTATLVSSVALASGDTLLAELTLQTKKTHSERLMPHIEEILKLAETGKDAIEAIAVSIGPGSFTGLRIGLGTAKALSYALHVPLVGVPTLGAMAFGCPVPGAVLAPTLDAQKGNLYVALYTWRGSELVELLPPQVFSLQETIDRLAASQEPLLVMGEAVSLYRDELTAAGIELAAPHIAMPRAGNVAVLGGRLLKQGVQHDAMSLEPLYIRRSEAEELWEKRQGTCS